MEQSLNGFDIVNSDPFKFRESLKQMAKKALITIDLSRGDPCDPPGSTADSVFSFFQSVAIAIQNSAFSRESYVADLGDYIDRSESPEEILRNTPATAEIYGNAKYFLEKVDDIISNEGLQGCTDFANLQKNFVFKELVKGIRSSGYGNELGEPIVRSIVSWYLKETLPNIDQSYSNIILTLGGSESIAVLFKVLRKLGFLPEQSIASAITPVYGPYNEMFDEYLLDCVPLETSYHDAYDLSKEAVNVWYDALIKHMRESHIGVQKKGCRIFVLVNPSNPTGRAYSAGSLQYLADKIRDLPNSDMAKTIVIEDIVYYDFMRSYQTGNSSKIEFNSLAEFLPDQTILVGSMSKTFRATGNRFGYIAIPSQTAKMLDTQFQHELKQTVSHGSFIDALRIFKSPDMKGAFSHTHMVPRISQWLGSIRLVFHEKDNKQFLENIRKRWFSFHQILKLKPIQPAAPYYCLVDFKRLILERARSKGTELEDCVNKLLSSADSLTAGSFILGLARRGVISLPASRFYIGHEAEHAWGMRFSVANQPLDRVVSAAKMINQYMEDILKVCETEVVQKLLSSDISFQILIHAKQVTTVMDAAAERGVSTDQVLKTMVCLGVDNSYYVALLPGGAGLSETQLSKVVNTECQLIQKENLVQEFSVTVGAISPLQLMSKVKNFVMDPRLACQEWVTMSTGNPIAGVRIDISVLKKILGGLCIVSPEELS